MVRSLSVIKVSEGIWLLTYDWAMALRRQLFFSKTKTPGSKR